MALFFRLKNLTQLRDVSNLAYIAPSQETHNRQLPRDNAPERPTLPYAKMRTANTQSYSLLN